MKKRGEENLGNVIYDSLAHGAEVRTRGETTLEEEVVSTEKQECPHHILVMHHLMKV